MSEAKFTAVLFDLDGTLLDTAPDFAVVLNQLRNKHNLPTLAYSDIRFQVSNGSKALIKMGFNIEESHPDFESKRQALLDLYLKHLAVHTTLFPTLDELLLKLEQRRVPWAIVTNKPVQYAQPLLEQLSLSERCASLICPDHVAERKPHPESLFLACEQMQVKPENCVYIGDHQRDIEAGIKAGMKTVSAAYGYIPIAEDCKSWGADWIVEDPAELDDILFT